MINGSADQRTEAEDLRVRFAAERTLLAWIRTGVALMGFGFVMARFGLFLREAAAMQGGLNKSLPAPSNLGLSLWIGTGMVLVGVLVNLLAAASHVRFIHRLERRQPQSKSAWSLGVLTSIVLGLIGLALTIYLVILHQ